MDVTVTFSGNATTLIRCGGLTVLSRRLREPALRIEDPPPLVMVVLSHMHGDHWDRVAATGLDQGLPVATTPHAAKRLHHRGFGNASGLQTWQHRILQADDTRLTVTALPGRHAPGPDQSFAATCDGQHARVRLRRAAPPDLHLRRHPVDRRTCRHSKAIPTVPAGRTLPFGLTVTMDGRQGAQAAQTSTCPR